MRSFVGIAAAAIMAAVILFFAMGVMALVAPSDADAGGGVVAPPPACSGAEVPPDFEFPNWNFLSYGDGFQLRVNETVVESGEPIRFSLTNEVNRAIPTEGKSKYVVQTPQDLGWRTVTKFRGSDTDFNDTAFTHEPGEGFEWTFRANATGFSKERYVVCEPLTPGMYRFVYVGADRTVGVRFRIVEPTNSSLENGQ